MRAKNTSDSTAVSDSTCSTWRTTTSTSSRRAATKLIDSRPAKRPRACGKQVFSAQHLDIDCAPQDPILEIRVKSRSVLSGLGVETKILWRTTYEEHDVVCIARVRNSGTYPVRHSLCAELRSGQRCLRQAWPLQTFDHNQQRPAVARF